MKRICLLYDGTWNKRDSQTNVYSMKEAIAPRDADGVEQLVFYDEGVGTHWYDSIRGGLFGHGLSKNIRQGWQYLSEHYAPGDQIYVLGFSRGAYTARSLVGLIRKCGVLKKPSRELVERAYKDIYRDRSAAPDDAKPSSFRAEHAHADRTDVQFIGVWDTVGSLGVPGNVLPFSRGYYDWHDTELSSIVRNAFHAVAVDEHRKSFPATLWQEKPKPDQRVEQVWFPGAHANVGGGYEGDRLRHLALRWMQERATDSGLAATQTVVEEGDHRAPIRDSYREFLFGIYRFVSGRKVRPYGGVGTESAHECTTRRMAEVSAYRPDALKSLWP